MKLKKFSKNKRRNRIIGLSSIGILLIIGSITLLKTFAFFEEGKTFNVLKGRVAEFSQADIQLAFTIDGAKSDNFPNKSDGYLSKNVSCENGVTAVWDNASWSLEEITNPNHDKKIKCSVDFITIIKQGKLTDYITNLATTDTVNLSYDETEDNNLRYIGTDPNNYVLFNGELWRIIGVMNNISDIYGNKEPRIKLIRATSIMSSVWDNKPDGVGSSTNSSGSNDWSDSTLQMVLNSGAYYNKTIGLCPISTIGKTKICDFSSIGLTTEAKSMMDTVLWNLGGKNSIMYTASDFYKSERETNVYTGHTTTWYGQVGLPYVSDYGFATSGGNTERSVCLSTVLASTSTECRANNWIGNKGIYIWLITPRSDYAHFPFVIIYNTGLLGGNANAKDGASIFPTIYLKTDIQIVSGDGSKNNPYKIAGA